MSTNYVEHLSQSVKTYKTKNLFMVKKKYQLILDDLN